MPICDLASSTDGFRRLLKRFDAPQLESLKGVLWQSLAGIAKVTASFLFSLVLARLLSAEEFGIVAIAMIVTALMRSFTDLGFGQAIIQLADIEDKHVRCCFAISCGTAALLSVLLAFFSQSIANAFGDMRLGPVLCLLSIAFFVSAMGGTANALLCRRLKFRKLAINEVIGVTIGYGMVSTVLAMLGWSYWSLAVGVLVQSCLVTALNLFHARHSVIPCFDNEIAIQLGRYGIPTVLVGVFAFVALKGDAIIVGKAFGASALGLYSRAYSLMELPLAVFGLGLSKVMFPAASRVQNDRIAFNSVFQTASKVSVALALPANLFLILVAPELVHFIYGDAWMEVVPLLRTLCIFGVFRMSYNTSAAFLRAKGQLKLLLVATIAYCVMVIGFSVACAMIFGVTGVPWAVGVSILLMWALVQLATIRAAGASFVKTLASMTSSAIPSCIAAVCLIPVVNSLRLENLPDYWFLLGCSAIFGALTMAFHLIMLSLPRIAQRINLFTFSL